MRISPWQRRTALITVGQTLRAQRASLHQDDFRLLQEFATQHDLMITEVKPEQRLVKVRGRASKMQAAFRADLGIYSDGKQQFRGRSGALSVPAEILPIVEAILGLDNRQAVWLTARAGSGTAKSLGTAGDDA